MSRSTVRKKQSVGLNLAQKGAVMLAVPLLFQLSLIGLLLYLHDRAESYAVRAGDARDLSGALCRLSTSGYSSIFYIDDALSKHEPLGAAGLQEVKDFASNAEDFKFDFHQQVVGQKRHAPINPQGNQPLSSDLWEWLQQVAQRRQISTLLTQPFEKSVYKRIDEMLVELDTMVRLVNAAAVTPANSPEHMRTFQQVQDNRHVLAIGLKDAGSWNPPKVGISPEYWSRDRIKWVLIIIAGSALNLGVVLLMILFFSRHIVQRVLVMLDNSFRLASQQRLHPPISGSDEIAQLDNAFHTMASALTEALDMQRSLVENARDVICSLDESATFTAVSSASSNVFGYLPEELVGSSLLNLIPDADAGDILARFHKIKEGSNSDPVEVTLIRKDRKIIDVLWSAYWSAPEGSMFCVAHDMTERKGAERLRQEVVQMVSHDLRSPLNTVQAFHEMLAVGMLGGLNEQGQKLLRAAERNTTRMLGLINDLLEIEKMEAGSLELNISDVSIASVFEQSMQSMSTPANVKGVKLNVIPTTLKVYADGDRLVQILVNLVSNAVKFTPPGAEVTVSASQVNGFVEFKVADQGRGIPAKLLGSIFDRFKQVQTSDAKGASGFGLGLAICKALVELHCGSISVESQEGVGSTFMFRIPANPPSMNREPASPERAGLAYQSDAAP